MRAIKMVLVACAAALAAPATRADEAVGKNMAETAAWLARASDADPWKIVEAGSPIPAGELLFGLPGSSYASANGAVTLTASSDFGGHSPIPVLEAAVVPHPAEDVDLDVTLDRGRIDLTNAKESGAATARVRFEDEQWMITLSEPGARVAIQMFGRWPAGVVFQNPDERPTHPIIYTLALAIKGHVELKTSEKEISLKEPPGVALAFWECRTGECAPPLHLNDLPDWADQSTVQDEQADKARVLLKEFRRARVDKGVEGAIDAFLSSDDTNKQKAALIAMGAQDDMKRLGGVMASAKNPQVWDTGIIVLRHWLGRNAAQRDKMLGFLTSQRGLTEPQARTVVDLLNGFNERELKSPVLYQLLIGALTADQEPMRNLAAWHLYRLVPGAREKIPFKPNATKEEYEAIAKQWQDYMPPGKVPSEIGSEEGLKPAEDK